MEMKISDLYSAIHSLNKIAICVVGYLVCAKIIEELLRLLNLKVLAFFPGISVEIVISLVDIFLVPYIGVYVLCFLGILISNHWN